MSTCHAPTSAQQLAAIQRKLNAWELIHLRALAASLHEQLEQTQAALERAQADIHTAWLDADMWREQTQNLIDDLRGTGQQVGMTITGELLVTTQQSSPGVDIDSVHAQRPGTAPTTAPTPTPTPTFKPEPPLPAEMMERLALLLATTPKVTIEEAIKSLGLALSATNVISTRRALEAIGCKSHFEWVERECMHFFFIDPNKPVSAA